MTCAMNKEDMSSLIHAQCQLHRISYHYTMHVNYVLLFLIV